MLKLKCITVDKVNNNKRLYPKEVFEKAMAEYEKTHIKSNVAFGEFGVGESPIVNLVNVSHKIVGFSWSGDTLMVDIEVLNTPSGKILTQMLEDKSTTFAISPRGLGSIKIENQVAVIQNDYEINAFDVIPEKDLA